MGIRRRRINNQTTMFQEIIWETLESTELAESLSATPVRGAPSGVSAGISSEDDAHTPIENTRPPYWEFDYEVEATGLKLTNINVRDTHSAGALEEVFEFIDFTDLTVEFTDGTVVPFDPSQAQQSGIAILEYGEQGRRFHVTPNDTLFQRGVRLKLLYNVLEDQGLTCYVLLEMSVVFRGAANDFDPGGVPVALDLWPQLAFTWTRTDATKRVKRFRGTVRYLSKNTMAPMGGMTSSNENVPGFFTDSNESFNDGRVWSSHLPVQARGARYVFGAPFGWMMVFDYLDAGFSSSREIVGVYGPGDGNKFIQRSSSLREQEWNWPPNPFPSISIDLELKKVDRQGQFDNTHNHAKMPLDSQGNVPVHAPFCGHSCLHLHWRWGDIAVTGATGGRGWQFKGWTIVDPSPNLARIGRRYMQQAYSLTGGPLIPPNQRLVFAITEPGHTRFNDDHIVNSASPGTLHVRDKLNWYCVDILDPYPDEKQVIFEQGMGWAYRYATPAEAEPVGGLVNGVLGITGSLPASPTQMDMANFFDQVYETFRYSALSPGVDQVQSGSFLGSRGISLEDL